MSKEKENKELKEWYLNRFQEFERKLNGHANTFLHEFRKESLRKFDEFDFPTLKNEEWKYTNIKPILKQNFIPAVTAAPTEVNRETVQSKMLKNFDCNLMVFVNGIFSKDLSKLDCIAQGVIIDSLENIMRTNPALLEKSLSQLSRTENAFNALNGAFALDGAFVYVPEGAVIEKPIQMLYLGGSQSEELLSLPRNLIIAGKSSQIRLIANYQSISGKKYFTNAVTEVFVEENAIVDFYKIQEEDNNSYHLEKIDVHQKRNSIFSHYSFSFGGEIVRNDLNSTMDEENIECNFYGLYLGNENQHVDNHTFVDHAKPNCVSNELYKGILDGQSRGVFNGKIMVREDAQKTQAYQSNKTVLLSDEARIDTKPQLEIFADDVKCSHGATVGHLDDEAYFYIRSRGVPSNLAKSMLIRAFANDVVEKIKIEELREQINHLIFEHLHRVEI